VQPLITALRDETWWAREAAAEALGELKDVRAVQPLIAALKNLNADVQEAAVEALGKIGDPRAVEPLIGLLRGEYFSPLRQAATGSLVTLYASGKLDDKTKKVILAHREKIARTHTDSHSDSCNGIHSEHTDIAAVEFPL